MSTYIDAYERIVKAIGHGFHPDTPGEDYLSLPQGIEPRDVDQAVEDVVENGKDPYAMASAILSPSGSVTVGAPVSVTLLDSGSIEVEVDLSEFLDGALEALEDGGQSFTEEEAVAADAMLGSALAARSGHSSGRLVVTLFPGAK